MLLKRKKNEYDNNKNNNKINEIRIAFFAL